MHLLAPLVLLNVGAAYAREAPASAPLSAPLSSPLGFSADLSLAPNGTSGRAPKPGPMTRERWGMLYDRYFVTPKGSVAVEHLQNTKDAVDETLAQGKLLVSLGKEKLQETAEAGRERAEDRIAAVRAGLAQRAQRSRRRVESSQLLHPGLIRNWVHHLRLVQPVNMQPAFFGMHPVRLSVEQSAVASEDRFVMDLLRNIWGYLDDDDRYDQDPWYEHNPVWELELELEWETDCDEFYDVDSCDDDSDWYEDYRPYVLRRLINGSNGLNTTWRYFIRRPRNGSNGSHMHNASISGALVAELQGPRMSVLALVWAAVAAVVCDFCI